jgi:hypothetical protein
LLRLVCDQSERLGEAPGETHLALIPGDYRPITKGSKMKLESETRKDKRNAFAYTFEHRHFATVAATLREYFEKNTMSPELKEDMVNHWADAMARTNSKFNRSRFIRAVYE